MSGNRPSIALLVTDLDNTLYDWFDIWYRSFAPMLAKLVEISGVPRHELIKEIKAVHQERGTSEYSHLIQELPSLRANHPDDDPADVYWPAVEAFRAGRKEAMRLYPGVLDTLMAAKEAGTTIVAYTESFAFYTALRLRWLGLDGLIDYLYSPADHEFPAGACAEQMRTHEDKFYVLRATTHRHTPPGLLKPSPDVLGAVVDEFAVPLESVAYVGDSLMKDVAMAQHIGVLDVHARYGTVQHLEEYELLRSVSHWPDTDVDRERTLTIDSEIQPTYALTKSFAELLDLFVFRHTAVK